MKEKMLFMKKRDPSPLVVSSVSCAFKCRDRLLIGVIDWTWKIVVVLVLVIHAGFGQQWDTRILLESDGLPTSIVYSVIRDSAGMLWVGHERGVSRFDGTNWLHFGEEEGLKRAVLGMAIYGGTLWCGTINGVYRLQSDSTSGRKPVFHHVNEFGRYTTAFLVVWDGKLWISAISDDYRAFDVRYRDAVNPGLQWCRREKDGYVFGRLTRKEGAPGHGITALTVSGDSLLAASSSIFRLNKNGDSYNVEVLVPSLYAYGRTGRVFWMHENSRGLFFSTDGGVFRLGRSGVRKLPLSRMGAIVSAEGYLWVTQPGLGVFKMSADGEEIIDILNTSNGLSNSYIHNYLWRDNDGSLWIPTYCGLTRLLSVTTRKYAIRKPVNTIAEFRGRVYLGVENKLYRVETDSRIKRARSFSYSESKLPMPFIEDMHPCEGQLWIMTSLQLVRYSQSEDPRSGAVVFSSLPAGKAPVVPTQLLRFVHTRQGGILFSMNRNLGYFRPDNKGQVLIFFDTSSRRVPGSIFRPGLPNAHVNCMLPDSSGAWIGTDDGLAYFNEKAMRVERPSRLHLRNWRERVNSLAFDTDGKLLVATRHGLFKDADTGFVVVLDEKASGPVNAILVNSGYIVAGGEKGLFVLRRFPAAVVSVVTSSLAHQAVTKLFRDSRNRIWVVTRSGVTRYDEDVILRKAKKVSLYVYRIDEDGRRLFDHILPSRPILPSVFKLSQDRCRVTIYCSTNHTGDEDLGTFEFTLTSNGVAKTYSTANPRFTTSPLSSGKYQCRVRSSLCGGPWSDPVEFTFIVPTPFYLTWWFLALLILAIAALILGAVQLRTGIIKKRNIELSKEVARRTEEIRKINKDLQASMEEVQELSRARSFFINFFAHDMSNALANMRRGFDLLQRGIPLDTEIGGATLGRFLQMSMERMLNLVRRVLLVSRIESGRIKVEKQIIDMREVLEGLVESYKIAVEEKNITLQYQCKGAPLVINTDIALVTEIVDNILGNAVKYSRRGGTVSINCNLRSRELLVTIDDSGPGFSHEDLDRMFMPFQKLTALPTGGESSTGLGMWIARSLMELLDGRIEVSNKPEGGASITLRFPVGAP